MSKIKLVILSDSELTPRWVDYFCLDEIDDCFDLEYWDCSDLVLPGFHFTEKTKKNYSYKIHSLHVLRDNLSRLPKNSLIWYTVHLSVTNKDFFKTLSVYFNNIINVDLCANNAAHYESDALERIIYRIKKRFLSLKGHISNNRLIPLLITLALHPRREIWERELTFYSNSVRHLRKLFTIYQISCASESKYKINHPDLEKYLDCIDHESDRSTDRVLVYLDQYYPYHEEFKELEINFDIQILGAEFNDAINAYFDKIEKIYNCKVVIAAHPASDYISTNAFNGRTVIKGRTAELVKNSIGVMMHYSNSLSYVMLYDKPTILLSGKTLKAIPFVYNAIVNTSKNWAIPIRDIDQLNDEQNFIIPELRKERRNRYIEQNFGQIDDANLKRNSELLPAHLRCIWEEIYGGL